MFARYEAPGKKFLYLAILGLMMIPGILPALVAQAQVSRSAPKPACPERSRREESLCCAVETLACAQGDNYGGWR